MDKFMVPVTRTIDDGRLFRLVAVWSMRLFAVLGTLLYVLGLMGGLYRVFDGGAEGLAKFSAVVAVLLMIPGTLVVAALVVWRSICLSRQERLTLVDLLLWQMRYGGEATGLLVAIGGTGVGVAQFIGAFPGSYAATRALTTDAFAFLQEWLLAGSGDVTVRLAGIVAVVTSIFVGYLVLHGSYLTAEVGALVQRYLFRIPTK
ncbi:MAG: hypothetical protein ACOYOB_10380 [Myxococcota bacterium]